MCLFKKKEEKTKEQILAEAESAAFLSLEDMLFMDMVDDDDEEDFD